MATTIYDEPWSPSNINCNWKPEKLSRYSFVTNLIDFNASGVKLGYEQNGRTEQVNSATNLTDYIPVSAGRYYYFKCEQNLTRGIRYVAFFTSGKIFLTQQTFNPGAANSLNGSIYVPANCYYIKITFYTQAWEKCSLRASYSNSLVSNEKDTTPLDIVDNKAGEQIYKDLHFEVYVKAEALIKNFVDCFNLRAFQSFPNDIGAYFDSYSQNSLVFNYNTKDYYKVNYPDSKFPNFQANYAYKVGDFITGTIYIYSERYVCLKDHTSASNFSDDYFGENIVTLSGNWASVSASSSNWLYVDKSIKETNYSEEIGFPYVGSLVFKNLWGCDMINYLNTYTNESYLTISYYDLFAKNLRSKNSNYDKYFQQGYFLDKNPSALNSNSLEGFGVRLIRGENFRDDDILGDTTLNNYFSFTETRHAVGSDWTALSDSVNTDYFNGSISKPFDHWYKFSPKRSIPFFKEKVFEDFKIELVLQREDTLGNVYQRVVELPILVTFTNNLIKCYFSGSNLNSMGIYSSEYLNSNAVNSFYYNDTGSHKVQSNIVIWCPNVKKLSVSSTIFNPIRVDSFPKLINMNNNENSPLEGQTCILHWVAKDMNVGETVTAIHTIEYSDGENYDKFIFIEGIRRNS